MAYRIEFSQPWGLPFFTEFLLTTEGVPIPLGANSHAFSVGRWPGRDGAWWRGCEAVTATAENGMIRTADPGLLVVSIPFARFDLGCGFSDRLTLPFRLIANPANATFASLLAEGTISFGETC